MSEGQSMERRERERTRLYRLTEDEIEQIADRAARRTITHGQNQIINAIGREALSTIARIVGLCIAAIAMLLTWRELFK